MAFPDEIRKCVCFVGYKIASGEVRLGGTAFWFSRLIEGTDRRFMYLVTARHVIDHIGGMGIAQVLLRLNMKSGSAVWAQSEVSDWYVHSEPSVDVAVMRAVIPPEVDHVSIGLEMAVTKELISAEQIGIGDEVFVTGLFKHHYGETNNIPIVRVGNIAAMPGEKVKTEQGAIEAYLIEARSIGGLSGSPVFVNLGMVRHGKFSSTGKPIFYWMGLVHGHFDVKEGKVDLADETIDDGVSRSSVNTGIAVVDPVDKVVETISQPPIKDAEDHIASDLRKKTHTVPDVVPPKEGSDSALDR
jgi:hypothetical protein